MRLHSVKLTNFRQHVDTTIEFGSGITGIIGQNGSGKTTIFEGVAWALYGNDAARGRRDSIRFMRADPKAPVYVELEFDLAGHRYRVVRGLSSAELYLDGGEVAVASSITTVSEMLHRRLGMTRAEFFNTYFTGQKELSVMTALGPTERSQFLSRVLGYERLRTAQELVRDRRRELTAEMTGLRQAMPDADVVARAVVEAEQRRVDATARAHTARETHDASQAELTALSPKLEAAELGRAHRRQAAADLRVAEADATARTRDVARLSAAVSEADAAVAELGQLAPLLAPLAALTSERDTLDVLAREDGRRIALLDSIRVADEELARLSERRTQLAELAATEAQATTRVDEARAELRGVTDALEAARTEWVRDRQEAETKREALRKQYADIKAQRERIIEAGEDGTCPTCQRPVGTHFRGMLDLLDAQMDAVKLDGNYFKSRVEQLSSAPEAVTTLDEKRRATAAVTAEIDRLYAQVQSAVRELGEVVRNVTRQEQRAAALRAEVATLPSGYDASRHTVVRRELERLLPLDQRASRLAVVADRSTPSRAALSEATAAVRAAEARAETLRTAVSDDDGGERAYAEVRAAYDRANAALRAAAIAVAGAEAEAAGAAESEARARAARADLAKAEARVAELTKERRLHDELDRAYNDLRTDLNFALRPEIAKVASAFIAELTDGRYMELDLDDQYNLVIVEDGKPKQVISGGEEDLANLVLRLAISQMIAERAGHAFSLLILDEVFGSLDDVRRQNVVELLRRLHDRFEQVVLITHIEAVHDGCDQVLAVRYDAGSGAAIVRPYETAASDDEPLAVVEQEA